MFSQDHWLHHVTTIKTSLDQLKNGFEQILIDAKTGLGQLKISLRIVFSLQGGLEDVDHS